MQSIGPHDYDAEYFGSALNLTDYSGRTAWTTSETIEKYLVRAVDTEREKPAALRGSISCPKSGYILTESACNISYAGDRFGTSC